MFIYPKWKFIWAGKRIKSDDKSIWKYSLGLKKQKKKIEDRFYENSLAKMAPNKQTSRFYREV